MTLDSQVLAGPVGGSGGEAASDVSVHSAGCCCPGCVARPAEPLAGAGAAYAASGSLPASLADTFKLHSLSGANHVIYLDFNGHTTSGTSWNSTYNGGSSIVSPAYDRDGNPNSFSDSELTEIQRIWQRVAEDFRPFGVDVTTEDPGTEALRKSGTGDTQWGVRAIQTADQSWLQDNVGYAVGGIAYTGSFTWNTDTPVFSFNSGEVNAADTLSHEVGHALGMTHDGVSGGGAYYYGHGSGATGWAPIMGAGFAKSLSQWSKGEYPTANQFQDDLAIITANNGFGYKTDDFGNTTGTATLLSWAGGGLSAEGLIERNTDFDFFAIDVSAGTLNLDLSPFERGPNLDILAELYNAAGQLVASSNPFSSLGASFSVLVSAGRYYLKVDGTGKDAVTGDPGYTDYGSLGLYTILGSFVGATTTPSVSVAVAPSSKNEDEAGTIAYTFTRTGDLSQALTISFSVGGTATYSSDYTVSGASSFSGTSGTITFTAGSSTAVLLLDPTADTAVELNETVLLTLLNGSGYTVSGTNSSATSTIVNDDAAKITIGDVSIIEGNSGTKMLTFTISLDRTVDAGFSLNHATANGTAVAGSDYVATSGSLSFTGTAGESKTVSVTINGDATVELDEAFELVLSGIAAAGRNVTFSRSRATGALSNDDAATISIADVSIAEGNSGTKVATFTVVLTGAVDAGFSLSYTTADGTAVAGGDYVIKSGSVAFVGSHGESQTISITISGDTTVELDEAFELVLSGIAAAGRNVGFSRSRATATVANDDTASLSIADASITEGLSGSKTLTFTVTLDRAVEVPVTLSYATANGSAVAGSDYVAKSGSLSFAGQAGETNTVTITILGDAAIELDETFAVVLSALAASGRSVVFSRDQATGTIVNDDQAVSAPTGLAATDHRSDGVIVTWSASPTATSYEVWRNTSNTLPASALAAGIATTSFTDATAQAGITYYYWVRAVNASGASGYTGSETGYVLPTLTLTVSQAAVLEDAASDLVFVFTRSGSPAGTLSANFTVGGTAVHGSDYTISGPATVSNGVGVVTFAAGSSTAVVRMRGTADAIVELNETVTLSLGTGAGYVIGGASSGAGTIQNDDAATISINDVSTFEGASGTKLLTFTVSLDKAVDAQVAVNYVTVDGSAVAGSDYTAESGTLTFAAGSLGTKFVSVVISGDTELEVNEAFEVVLTSLNASGRNVTLSRNRGTGTIGNDDDVPAAPTGLQATTLRSDDVRLSWQSAVGAIGYQVWRNTVNSPPASPLALGVSDTSFIDSTAQAGVRYYYWVRAVNMTGTSDFSASTAGYMLPTVSVSSAPAGVLEDASGGLIYTFTRTGSTSESLTVHFNVAGTATFGSDFTAAGTANFSATSGSVTFAAGSSVATIGVMSIADNVVELDESVGLTIVSSFDYAVGSTGSGTSVIVNDDSATLSIGDAIVTEGHSGIQSISFTVTLNRAVDTGLSVSFATANGTAIAGTDYFAGNGTLVFAGQAGETKTISITILGDRVVESDETFDVLLGEIGASSRAVAVGRSRGIGTVTNDDLGDPVGLVVGPNAGLEPLIKVYDSTGDTLRFQFHAYAPAFTNGVHVALGDINGDGVSDIVVAPVSGVAPIRVFDGTNGELLSSFFPYAQTFNGGITIAVGDVNGDGRGEIFAGLASKGGAIRVFDGGTGNMLASYYAFAKNYTGGLNIAAGDVDADGRSEVVAALSSGSGSAVRVIDALSGSVRSAYYAFDKRFRGGVNVATGDVDADGRAEVIASPESGSDQPVAIFDALSGSVRTTFFAFSSTFDGGISVGAGDLNGDGRAEVIAAPASGLLSVVRVFDATSTQMLKYSQQYPAPFAGGVFVAGKGSPGKALYAASPAPAVSSTSKVTLADAKAIAKSVATRFAAAGASAEMLARIAATNIIIADLPGATLGRTRDGAIVVDVNAGGLGWFIDRTPNIDEEFVTGTDGITRATSPTARGKVDLLTVIAHELAHQLGFRDIPLASGSGSLMSMALPASVRRATNDQIGALFSDFGLLEGVLAGAKA